MYEKIKKVAISNIKKDAKTKVVVKYLGRGYDLSEVSDEFTADLVAEALHDMTFIQILRATAPETIQPILKAVESVIAQIKAIVRVLAGGNIEVNDSVLPFIESAANLHRSW